MFADFSFCYYGLNFIGSSLSVSWLVQFNAAVLQFLLLIWAFWFKEEQSEAFDVTHRRDSPADHSSVQEEKMFLVFIQV